MNSYHQLISVALSTNILIMKIIKRSLLLILSAILVIFILNYPKLNIIAGYSAKNINSSVFLAGRTLEFTDTEDNQFSPINLADDAINLKEKTTTSSVFGLLTRKAIYKEGLGGVLITSDDDITAKRRVPKRTKPDNNTPFPQGNADQKDTVFANVNYNELNKIVTNAFDKKNKTRAVLVIYKNQIIAEKYADGFDKNARILGWSMTKSVMATVFGILQYQQKINVQDNAPISAWKNDERSKITIHNLLQMNSGLQWDEDYESISDVSKMLFLEKDMTKSQINKPFAGKPNESWNYSSGTSNLLSGVLRSQFTTHQAYLDFWYSNLIDQIGMNSMVIETDLSGNFVGSSYAWATPRDWAKFGLLYVHKGNWFGTQLFSPEWVNYVSTPSNGSNGQYGAHFWLNSGGKYPDVDRNMYSANGYQGQRVFIFPDRDLVVVRMGLTSMDYNGLLSGVVKAIE